MKRCICSMIMCAALAWMPMAAQQDGGCFVAKVTEAGQLAEVMGERANEIDSIAVFGPINEADIDTLAGASYYGKLSFMDLKDAEIDKIPDKAFYALGDHLKSIILPVKTTEIGSLAFSATGLDEIILPEALRTIGEGAFYGCKLSEIIIPEGVEVIPYYAFNQCENLKKVVLPSTIKTLESESFFDSGVAEINFPEGLECIKARAFGLATELTTAILPNTCKIIEEDAFNNCFKLEEVRLPDGLETVSRRAFYLATELETIEIPKSVTEIEAEAFNCCYKLKSVKLSENIKEIQTGAFMYCVLDSVSLPANVEFLNGESFASNPLQKIYSYSANPPKFGYTNNSKSPFEGVDNTIPVYVPKGSLELYKNSDWKYFTNIIEDENMPSGIVDATADNSVAVSTANGCIEISAPAGAAYTIYTVDGREMANGTATETRIALPKGIYIVRAAGNSYKVSL